MFKRLHRSKSTTSRQETEMADKNVRELQGLANTGNPVQRLQLLCLSRGGNGLLGLGRIFRNIDNDGNENVTRTEFVKGLKDMGLEITDEEAVAMFDYFDTDGKGSINVDEFLECIRPPLNETREKVIDNAFRKMDKNGDGIITIKDLKRGYNVKAHTLYIAGEESEDCIMNRFLENFEVGLTDDGQVTREEFLNYYAGISASIENDGYFDLIMRQAYKL